MDHNRNERRKNIAAYLVSSQKLNQAAREVIEYNFDEKEAAAYYMVDYMDLCSKVNNVRYKKCFNEDRRKCNAAVEKYFEYFPSKINVANIDKFSNATLQNKMSDIANIYEISITILRHEIRKAVAMGSHNYSYDRNVNYSTDSTFTYLEEESLLTELIIWNIIQSVSGQGVCTCYICALEKLSTIAYEMIQIIKGKQCPEYWTTHGQADIKWLINFEMRNSEEFFLYFERYYCSYEV